MIGAINAATARLAAADTTLSRPEMPATSGAVTSCAAHATQTASASGLGQPAATRRRDQIGAMITSAAVATTDNASPTSTANCGVVTINSSTVAASAGIACRRRDDSTPTNAIAPITAARSTLAEGWTTTTNSANVTPASPTAARGPISRAENSTAPQTIVTLAPDTAVRCVKPAVRNSWPVTGVTVDMSPSTSAGSIAAWSAGSTRRAAAAKPARTAYAARLRGPAVPIVGAPVAVRTATLKSRRVGAVIRARKRIGWPTITAPKSRAGAKTTARPGCLLTVELPQRRRETAADCDRPRSRSGSV